MQDWKRHKPECVAPEAAAAGSGASSSTAAAGSSSSSSSSGASSSNPSVLVKLSAQSGEAPYQMVVSNNCLLLNFCCLCFTD
jgi:hypothetical protein